MPFERGELSMYDSGGDPDVDACLSLGQEAAHVGNVNIRYVDNYFNHYL